MGQGLTSFLMVPRICILPTSRRPKVSTDTIRSSQRSSAMSAPSRVSLTSTFLYTCIFISSFPQRWGHCRFYFAAYWPPADDYFVCNAKRGFHSALDHSVWLQYSCSWRVLCAIWRTGCLGCDSHTARRDESTRIPCHLPRCCIPNWERMWFCYTMWLVN